MICASIHKAAEQYEMPSSSVDGQHFGFLPGSLVQSTGLQSDLYFGEYQEEIESAN
jgi:hypothetical protein